MSSLNPYESYSAGRDALAIISETPAKLAGILKNLDATVVEAQPAPGKWSVRETLCHLADTEMVFSFRIRQTLAEDNPTIQPFDQDLWAKNYAAYTAQAAFELFKAVRQWNVLLLGSLAADQFDRATVHPERGAMTLRTIVETMAGHDLNHLVRLPAPV